VTDGPPRRERSALPHAHSPSAQQRTLSGEISAPARSFTDPVGRDQRSRTLIHLSHGHSSGEISAPARSFTWP
jgi:hypothetical protein